MAIFDSDVSLASLTATASATERKRKRQFEAETTTALDNAVDAGALLLQLFTVLPGAIIEAHKAQHELMVERHGAEDPRAQDAAAAFEDMSHLDAIARPARARIARALSVRRMTGAGFHGFVEDQDGVPVVGARVQLVGGRSPRLPRATTEEDGYFVIALDARTGPGKDDGGENPEKPRQGATVRIVDRTGELLYEDAIALEIQAGSAYREYRVSLPDGSSKPTQRPRRSAQRKVK